MATVPCTRVGRRTPCQGPLPPDPPAGPFGSLFVSSLGVGLAEVGDKTQIAPVGLAARFKVFYPVVVGTTLGMMASNIPAVLIGNRTADKLRIRAVRIACAIVFAALGAATLLGYGR